MAGGEPTLCTPEDGATRSMDLPNLRRVSAQDHHQPPATATQSTEHPMVAVIIRFIEELIDAFNLGSSINK